MKFLSWLPDYGLLRKLNSSIVTALLFLNDDTTYYREIADSASCFNCK